MVPKSEHVFSNSMLLVFHFEFLMWFFTPQSNLWSMIHFIQEKSELLTQQIWGINSREREKFHHGNGQGIIEGGGVLESQILVCISGT